VKVWLKFASSLLRRVNFSEMHSNDGESEHEIMLCCFKSYCWECISWWNSLELGKMQIVLSVDSFSTYIEGRNLMYNGTRTHICAWQINWHRELKTLSCRPWLVMRKLYKTSLREWYQNSSHLMGWFGDHKSWGIGGDWGEISSFPLILLSPNQP
jgi:hypothetical protein